MSFNINDLVIEKVTTIRNPWYNGYCNNCKLCKDEICTSQFVDVECKYIALCRNIKEKEGEPNEI